MNWMMTRKRIEEARKNKIEVVLNQEEKDKITKMALVEGLPISTFIRWKIMKK